MALKGLRCQRHRDRGVAGDDQQVLVAGCEHRVVGKRFAKRAKYRGHQRGVDFVELEPLHEDPVRIQVGADPSIEFSGKQARHAAHPGIGWLRNEDVITPVAGREETLCIINDDRAARIGECSTVAWREPPRGFDHCGLDFHGFYPLDGEALQQRVHGEAGADTDDGGAPGVWFHRKRDRPGQYHGDLVRATGAGAHVDRAIGLAVGADAVGARIVDHVNRRGFAVLLIQHLRVV